jgi:hypothetical protein
MLLCPRNASEPETWNLETTATVAMQRPSKHITAATDELLNAMFPMRSTPYQIQCGRILYEYALLNSSCISKLAEFKTRFETHV